MNKRSKLALAAVLTFIGLQFSSQSAQAFTQEECQIKHEILVSRIESLQAVIRQAFVSNLRTKYVIQKLRNQQITQLKGEYMSQCAEYIP